MMAPCVTIDVREKILRDLVVLVVNNKLEDGFCRVTLSPREERKVFSPKISKENLFTFNTSILIEIYLRLLLS